MPPSKSEAEEHAKLILILWEETTLFPILGFAVWLLFALLLYRAQWLAKKRRRKEDMFVVLETQDGGDAHYMVSFFTQGNYQEPPTGIVLLHLIGSLYPGKIHELVAHSLEDTFHLFPPLCRDKFLVTEDVCLGRMIGIVLQTTIRGSHPVWNCESIIVRDIHTNEAWYFHGFREIGWPPRTFYPATHEELCTFKFSFRRRLRREIRNGQLALFSFWFRSTESVFTRFERLVTSAACYLLLFVSCFIFLDFVFPPGHGHHKRKKGYLANGTQTSTKHVHGSQRINVHGETEESYWLQHIVVPALLSALITSFAGFCLVSFFRQQSTYENNFEEMDYVIGTALHESDHMKELHLTRACAESICGDAETQDSDTTRDSRTLRSEARSEASSEEKEHEDGVRVKMGDLRAMPLMVAHDPTRKAHLITVAEEKTWTRRILRRMRGLNPFARKKERKAKDALTQQKLPTAPSSPKPSLSQLGLPARSTIFEPEERPFEPELARVLSPLEERIEMRKLFLGRNLHDHFIPQGCLGGRKAQPFQAGINKTGSYKRAKRKAYSMMGPRSRVPHPEEKYLTLDPEENPYDLGSIEAPKRKWYQPVYAWITVVLVIGLGTTFVTVSIVKGRFHASAELFLNSVLSTYVVSLLMATFILEPLKITLIAFYFSLRDRSMYKRISAKTKARRKEAQVLLHMNRT